MAKEPFELPNNQCVRATRNEMSSMRMVLIMASEVNHSRQDLEKRLDIVPDGNERMTKVADELNDLFQDIMGTVSDNQRRVLRNSEQDYEVRIVPKASTDKTCLAVSKQDMTNLVDCAREKCRFCSLNGEEAKDCALYKFLEAYIPLDDYDGEFACPYAYQTWANQPALPERKIERK